MNTDRILTSLILAYTLNWEGTNHGLCDYLAKNNRQVLSSVSLCSLYTIIHSIQNRGSSINNYF